MKKQTVLLSAAGFLLLALFAFLGYRWFSGEPDLTVHLRCEENINGKLSAVRIFPDGKNGEPESFDLAAACRAGNITVNNYRREEKIQFAYERSGGETHQVISEYGEHIQSDQTGFYAVLKLIQTSPFIIKDKI